MRACVQRVSRAQVSVNDQITGRIKHGMVVLLGIADGDTERDVFYLADKLVGLRIFEDENGKMNRSVKEVDGGMLIISQFTLLGDCRKGRRPSFVKAATPEIAQPLYDQFVAAVASHRIPVECGVFRAHMDVELVNDGPVTLIVEGAELL